jgi:hypothetical protein
LEQNISIYKDYLTEFMQRLQTLVKVRGAMLGLYGENSENILNCILGEMM